MLTRTTRDSCSTVCLRLKDSAWSAGTALGIGMGLAAILAIASPPSAVRSDAAGRIDNARLSDAPGGAGQTTFGAGTRVVYLNFDYADMASRPVTVTVLDAAGNVLFTASRTLADAGSAAIPLDSLVVVDRTYDALDDDTTSLILAIDDAQANLNDLTRRFQYIQNALALTNRMRGAATALGGLPLAPEASAALDALADHLAEVRAAGQAALQEPDTATVITLLQTMRRHAVDLIVNLRDARAHGGSSGFPFPPSVDCQPYAANLSVAGKLRRTLEFAIGDPGAVADIQLRPGRPVLYPGLRELDTTAVFATLVDLACAPVRDGTLVTFAVEPASVAVVSPVTATTRAGAVQVYLRAIGTAGGTVRVSADAGRARSVIVVAIGLPPRRVTVVAGASQLVAGQTTTIEARVSDNTGRAVPNGTGVTFTIAPPDRGQVAPAAAVTERGVARTLLSAGPSAGQVTVTANVGSVQNAVTVVVLPAPSPGTALPPAPTVVPTPGPSPTAVPVPPTAVPGTTRPACAGRMDGSLCDGSLVVQVYRDDGCNRRFDRAWDRNLVGIPVTLRFGNGHTESQPTADGGVVLFGALNLPPGMTLDVYAELPPDRPLCYNSLAHVTLDAADFEPSRYARVTFRAR
jgi:hypothetical protein